MQTNARSLKPSWSSEPSGDLVKMQIRMQTSERDLNLVPSYKLHLLPVLLVSGLREW